MVNLIDSHAHIDMPDLLKDIDNVLTLAKNTGLKNIIIPGVNLEDMPEVIKLIEKYDHLYGGASIHPQDVEKWNDKSYIELDRLLKHSKIIAVGEAGLDYYWVKDNKELQKEVFNAHIKLASENNLPLIVHSRDAHEDTYVLIRAAAEQGLTGVMHCFSGSAELAVEYTKLGFYIGLGGPITFKNAKKPKAVAEKVPIEFLMIETDSPYLTPHPYRGKRPNMPHYVKYVAEEISRIKNLSFEEVAEITTQNALKLFKIK
ncbi:MAG: TatD family hydrolase [Cyanobacteriota bacterium]